VIAPREIPSHKASGSAVSEQGGSRLGSWCGARLWLRPLRPSLAVRVREMGAKDGVTAPCSKHVRPAPS
jgi:hypothetical protein